MFRLPLKLPRPRNARFCGQVNDRTTNARRLMVVGGTPFCVIRVCCAPVIQISACPLFIFLQHCCCLCMIACFVVLTLIGNDEHTASMRLTTLLYCVNPAGGYLRFKSTRHLFPPPPSARTRYTQCTTQAIVDKNKTLTGTGEVGRERSKEPHRESRKPGREGKREEERNREEKRETFERERGVTGDKGYRVKKSFSCTRGRDHTKSYLMQRGVSPV